MACANCSALREENAKLRGLLGLERVVDDLGLIAAAFPVQPQCGRLLLRLYAAHPRYISRRALEHHINTPSAGGLSVQISRVRKILGADALVTERQVGVRLGDEAKARMDEILGRAQQVA